MPEAKITSFDRQATRLVSDAAKEALEAVAARFGLTLKVEGGKFDPSGFTPKFTFVCVAESGVPADFVQYCAMFGLSPEDHGKTFIRANGDTAKIVGLHPNRPRFPIGVEIRGKAMLLTEEEVRRRMGKSQLPPTSSIHD